VIDEGAFMGELSARATIFGGQGPGRRKLRRGECERARHAQIAKAAGLTDAETIHVECQAK
jgi:hypothetical protein